MVNYIPIIGWLISLLFNTFLAIPFWFLWTACGVGRVYFYWLPATYLDLPFFHCIGLFMVISMLKVVLTPKLLNQDVNVKKDKD